MKTFKLLVGGHWRLILLLMAATALLTTLPAGARSAGEDSNSPKTQASAAELPTGSPALIRPEELAKAIPILVVAWIWRQYWPTQAPRDYLFLGAVSGLVFGAAEVVHYFTDVLGSISGNATGQDLQTLTIQYVWRFLTDPIDHACWAGITGYFIGLAITGPYRKYSIGLVGIGIASVLHGLNDWNPVNSHFSWVLVTLISVLLFLGYARAGAWLPQQAMAAPDGLAMPPAQAPPWPAAPPAPSRPAPSGGVPPGSPAPREWWQHVPAPSAPPAQHAAARPYNPATAPTVVQQRPPVRPWWEQ